MRLKEKNYIAANTRERESLPLSGKIEPSSIKDMTSRNLFNLVLKILGIYFIKDILAALSQSISALVYLPGYSSSKEAFYNLAMAAGPLLVYLLCAYLLLFQTHRIINWLNLDKFAGQDILPLRIHRSIVLSIAIILAGGLTLVNEIPELFRHCIYYVQERKLYTRMARPDISYVLMAALKVMIGFFLIIWNRPIVNFIEVRRKNKVSWYWPFSIPFLQNGKKKEKNLKQASKL